MSWSTRSAKLMLMRSPGTAVGLRGGANRRPPLLAQQGGSRRWMGDHQHKKTSFIGALSSSLGEVLKFGNPGKRRDWSAPPASKFYRPESLQLTYDDLVAKIQKKLFTYLRCLPLTLPSPPCTLHLDIPCLCTDATLLPQDRGRGLGQLDRGRRDEEGGVAQGPQRDALRDGGASPGRPPVHYPECRPRPLSPRGLHKKGRGGSCKSTTFLDRVAPTGAS